MLSEVFSTVARVTGEMALASVRGRAPAAQVRDWATRLRSAAALMDHA